MAVRVSSVGEKREEIEFPKLMVSGITGALFLINSMKNGCYVGMRLSGGRAGEYSTDWGDHLKDFDGVVTLSNA